ncbi:MAG: XrtA system polysaccharide chain length determinant [Vicinamibacteria bacterium]
MEREEQGSEGLELATGVFRRQWRAAFLCFLVVFSATFTVVWFLPDIFESAATVLIERQQIPNEMVRSTITSGLETRLQTISQEIFSRARLEGLIDRFGLYEDAKASKPIEAVLESMKRDIALQLKGSGQRGNRTTIAFTVSYKGSDPQKVAVVTNTLASFFIEENLKVREEQASSTSQFFRVQLEEAQKELKQIEERVSVFKRDHLGQLPHQLQANLGSLEQLNTRLRLNSDRQMRNAELVRDIEKQIAEATQPTEAPNATAVRVAELRDVLRNLRKRYSDQYPDVVRVKAEIAALAERLGEEGAGVTEAPRPDTPMVTELRKSLDVAMRDASGLKLEADRLAQAMAQFETRLDRAPLAEQQFQVLMRDYETTTELYRSLLLRQKEAELAENMEQRQKGEQFRIIDPAIASQIPAAPNRPMLWAIAALVALAAAGGVAVAKEQLDTSYHSANDLRGSASVPILASIPRIVTARDRRRSALKTLVGATSCIVGLALLVGASYWFAVGNVQLASLLMR